MSSCPLQPSTAIPQLNSLFPKGESSWALLGSVCCSCHANKLTAWEPSLCWTLLHSPPSRTSGLLPASSALPNFKVLPPYRLLLSPLSPSPLGGFWLTEGFLLCCGHRQRYHLFFYPAQLERHRDARGHRSGTGRIAGKWHH